MNRIRFLITGIIFLLATIFLVIYQLKTHEFSNGTFTLWAMCGVIIVVECIVGIIRSDD